ATVQLKRCLTLTIAVVPVSSSRSPELREMLKRKSKRKASCRDSISEAGPGVFQVVDLLPYDYVVAINLKFDLVCCLQTAQDGFNGFVSEVGVESFASQSFIPVFKRHIVPPFKFFENVFKRYVSEDKLSFDPGGIGGMRNFTRNDFVLQS